MFAAHVQVVYVHVHADARAGHIALPVIRAHVAAALSWRSRLHGIEYNAMSIYISMHKKRGEINKRIMSI